MQMGRIDGYNKPSTTKKDTVFTWTDVYEDEQISPAASGVILIHYSCASVSLPVLTMIFSLVDIIRICICYIQLSKLYRNGIILTNAGCQCLYYLYTPIVQKLLLIKVRPAQLKLLPMLLTLKTLVRVSASTRRWFLVKKLWQYRQMSHIPYTILFGEVTSMFRHIIQRNRYVEFHLSL